MAELDRHHPTNEVGAQRWKQAFMLAFTVLFCVKVTIACVLAPFGDEAFYWQESRQLAWGYSDLPPLTAWLIRFGETLAGHSVFGMRWPFLLIGATLPWLVVVFTRQAFGTGRTAWQAGLLCLALPLAGSLGVLALPDVPLTVAIQLALLGLLRAMRDDRRRDWLLLGIALAVCWLAHYRAVLPMLAGLLVFVLAPRGRAQWRRSGLWLAMAVAILGVLPIVISNWQLHGAAILFQAVQRNAWGFHRDALLQPLEQALACTPLLYGWLLWAAWHVWRRRRQGAPWDLLGITSLSLLLVYFGVGLFADDLRFRAHWPLPGYLPLLAALPVLWARLPPKRLVRGLIGVTVALAVAGQLTGLAYLGVAATQSGADLLSRVKAFPANFVGWRQSAVQLQPWLTPRDEVLVADNFMLAAELDFQLNGQRPIYVLDSPLNVKHGRAAQLAMWQRDEVALRRDHAGASMLLAVEETALRERERAAWLGSICQRATEWRPLSRLDLYHGRKRIAFYRAQVPEHALSEAAAASCVVSRAAAAAE